MHLLGFFHEHTREDRDQYITVYEENILDGMFGGGGGGIKDGGARRTLQELKQPQTAHSRSFTF